MLFKKIPQVRFLDRPEAGKGISLIIDPIEHLS
jgi:hypothetical protein